MNNANNMHDLVSAYDVARFMDWQKINDSEAVTVQDYTRFDNDWQYPGTGPWEEKIGRYRVPLSVIMETTRWAGARPWICIPHGASEALIWYIVDNVINLSGGMRPIFEYSNEVWNGQFDQHRWCLNWGNRSDPNRWLRCQAQKTRDLARIVGGRGDVVLGGWVRNDGNTRFLLNELGLKDVVTAMTFGVYFGNQITSASSLPNLRDQLRNDISNRLRNELILQKQAVDQSGVQMWAYEGGQHLFPRGNTPLPVQNLFKEINRSPMMAQLHQQLRNTWDEIGGGLFCWYSLYGQYTSRGGSFGLNEIDANARELTMRPKSFVF